MPTIRDLTREEAAAQRIPEPELAPDHPVQWRAAEQDGSLAAIARIDPRGCTTEPDVPLMELRLPVSAARVDEASVHALIEAVCNEVGRMGADRIVARCDPLTLSEIRRLETAGFRPTGRGPYVDYGGGYVEYIDGYRDAAGSMIDLAKSL